MRVPPRPAMRPAGQIEEMDCRTKKPNANPFHIHIDRLLESKGLINENL